MEDYWTDYVSGSDAESDSAGASEEAQSESDAAKGEDDSSRCSR